MTTHLFYQHLKKLMYDRKSVTAIPEKMKSKMPLSIDGRELKNLPIIERLEPRQPTEIPAKVMREFETRSSSTLVSGTIERAARLSPGISFCNGR